MLGPVFHRYHDGTRFGRLACQLVEKDGFEGFKARVFFCAQKAIAWTEPLTSAIEVIRQAIEVGVVAHDLPYASFSCFHLITDLLLQGLNLDQLWNELQRCLDFVSKVKIGNMVIVLISYQRFILSLRGQTEAFSSFSDAEFREETFEASLAADSVEHFANNCRPPRKLAAIIGFSSCRRSSS
jgi:hypothetical protein